MDLHYNIIRQDWLEEGRPLLVFLHEGLGSIGQWKDFPALLSAQTELPALVYDRYGYGQSPDRGKAFHTNFLHEEALEVLPAFLSSLEIDNPIILFGHSDGGTLALLHASNPFPKTLGCIAEAPHVILERISFAGIRIARGLLDNEEMLARLTTYHGSRTRQLVDDWTGFWLSESDGDWDMKEELQRIQMPLCIIQGDEDHFGTFKQLDAIQENVASEVVELHKMKGCGHVPHLQMKEDVLEISTSFIRRLLPE